MRSELEYEEAMRWVAWGLSSGDVARLTGIPKNTIKSWLRFGHGTRKSGPNHSRSTYEEAMRYSMLGMNDCDISRLMGISHRTIQRWRNDGLKGRREDKSCPLCGDGSLHPPAYAYLLGMYLGDGHIIATHRGVYRLTIYLDAKYPEIVEECATALIDVRTNRSDRVTRRLRDGCTELSAYWKHWPCLFPQHGPGMKHKRKIALTEWQTKILHTCPERLLRGLIHSDGCRGINTILRAGKRYEYPRYQFRNCSPDVRRIFCDACDAYGVRWRRMNSSTIAVSRRDDVVRLDEIVGPKR